MMKTLGATNKVDQGMELGGVRVGSLVLGTGIIRY